jgi:hypothetical protein
MHETSWRHCFPPMPDWGAVMRYIDRMLMDRVASSSYSASLKGC